MLVFFLRKIFLVKNFVIELPNLYLSKILFIISSQNGRMDKFDILVSVCPPVCVSVDHIFLYPDCTFKTIRDIYIMPL